MVIARTGFTDPDSDPLTYTLSLQGGNLGNAFGIDNQGWILSTGGTRDFLNRNSSFTLCVEARDSGGLTAERCIPMDTSRD